jgi:hypothetical protein
MLADLRFHLSRLLISSCAFSRSGGTETELADFRPPSGLRSRPTAGTWLLSLEAALAEVAPAGGAFEAWPELGGRRIRVRRVVP